MERNDRTNHRYGNSIYTDGSAARRLAPVPDDERLYSDGYPEEEIRKKRRPSKKARRIPALNFLSLLFLIGVIALTLYTCISYLKAQADITIMKKEIKTLESELAQTQKKNDAMLASMNEALDLDYIYSVAVGELGMVYPNDNTVIQYETPQSGYVRQYEEIPAAQSSSILDDILE